MGNKELGGIGQPATVHTSIFDAKGDLLAARGNDVVTTVPIGTNGQVLSADSTTDSGLSWVSDAASSLYVPKVGVYANPMTDVFVTSVTGDVASEFVLSADGRLEWGGGVGALDVNLYRSDANTLTTDDLFQSYGGVYVEAGLTVGLAAPLTLSGGSNVVLDGITGSKIGTATTQKLAFYNATPIVQGASIADPAGGATVDAEARTAITALISRIEALGLIATV